ncbi:MAG: DNA helicase UvrD, partial [Coriobacteriaceae bacterium]|nr:DNA helicase UvrD [Coriobacteriaceae bacterium]
NSVAEAKGLEEDRRLAYVAITRARKTLCLTCAYARKIFGQSSANPVSRFVNEIPANLRTTTGLGSAGFSGIGWEKRGSRKGISGSGVEAGRGQVFGKSVASAQGEGGARFGAGVDVSAHRKAAANISFVAGDVVEHKVFGRGKVKKVDGDTLHIEFAKTGTTKKLMKEFAPIVKVG